FVRSVLYARVVRLALSGTACQIGSILPCCEVGFIWQVLSGRCGRCVCKASMQRLAKYFLHFFETVFLYELVADFFDMGNPFQVVAIMSAHFQDPQYGSL